MIILNKFFMIFKNFSVQFLENLALKKRIVFLNLGIQVLQILMYIINIIHIWLFLQQVFWKYIYEYQISRSYLLQVCIISINMKYSWIKSYNLMIHIKLICYLHLNRLKNVQKRRFSYSGKYTPFKCGYLSSTCMPRYIRSGLNYDTCIHMLCIMLHIPVQDYILHIRLIS